MPVRVGLKYIDIWKDSMEKAVCKYEEEPIEKGQIVFYGPSNFTRWCAKWGNTPLREAILGKSGKHCAINRGFGSSCTEHQLYYYPRMVRPLEPKVLVYSPLGNYSSFGYSFEEAWELAQRVIAYAFADFPEIRIYLCGAHRRRENTEESLANMEKANSVLKEFAENTPNCYFLNPCEDKALSAEDIFSDGAHYNQKGYEAYAEFFKSALKEELDLF
jgi:tetratricopeptide (TPR) repeat protein